MYYIRAATGLEYYRGPDSHDIPFLSYYWQLGEAMEEL